MIVSAFEPALRSGRLTYILIPRPVLVPAIRGGCQGLRQIQNCGEGLDIEVFGEFISSKSLRNIERSFQHFPVAASGGADTLEELQFLQSGDVLLYLSAGNPNLLRQFACRHVRMLPQ